MIQQRLNESDEEYEKRKRRVKLTMMGSLAHGGGVAISVVTAAILYNMDTFNVVDTATYITQTEDATSYIEFPATAYNNSNVTVQYDIKTTDTSCMLLGSHNTGRYAGVVEDGSVSTVLGASAGTPSYYINDVLFTGTTRDDLHTLVATGLWVTVKITNLDLTLFNNVRTTYNTTAFTTSGNLRNFKLDLGSTGTWDNESVLGDDSGFTQSNITTDIGSRTIDNAGSEGITSDGDMYGSNHVYLNGVDQSVDYPLVVGSSVIYYAVSTKSFGAYTAASTPVSFTFSHSSVCILKGGKVVTAGDLTELDANPEDITRMVDGVATVGTYSFSLTDIDSFYPGNEGESSEAYIQNIMTPLLTDVKYSNVFDTGISGFTVSGSSTVTWDSINERLECDVLGTSGGTRLTIPTPAWANKRVRITFDLEFGTYGGSDITLVWSTSTTIGTATEGTGKIVEFTPTSDTDYIKFQRTGTVTGTFYMDNVTVEIIDAVVITNFTTACRTTLENTNYGPSNFLYTQDSTGRWTGMHTEGEIKGGTDGRNIDINMTIPYNHVVTKDIDKIEGSLTECTITYADTTTLVVP